MENNEVQDFADRVKKYYYCKAELCETLMHKGINIESNLMQMTPVDYNPFDNCHAEAYSIGCAALEGLSSIYQEINQHGTEQEGSKKRFISFLKDLRVSEHLERISTPFLYYCLEKQGIEESFRNEIKKKWIDQKSQSEAHRFYSDPKIDEIKLVYQNCHAVNQNSSNETILNLDRSLQDFTYAALIYKFYRCSFIHEFRASQYAVYFNRGNQISVRKFESHLSPSREYLKIDDPKPQLDVGIGLFTESIRKGADVVHNLIIEKQCRDIRYNSTDEIRIKLKKT